jgi:CRP-like cAMP-binding protein
MASVSGTEDARRILAESVVFRNLETGDLDHIVKAGKLLDAPAGELLLAEHGRGAGLHVILEGTVEFFLPEASAGGHRPTMVRLNTLGAGKCFGEYSLIDDQAISASARARTPVKLFFISREEFRKLTDGMPRMGKTIYFNLLQFLVRRLRDKDRELDLFWLVDENT